MSSKACIRGSPAPLWFSGARFSHPRGLADVPAPLPAMCFLNATHGFCLVLSLLLCTGWGTDAQGSGRRLGALPAGPEDGASGGVGKESQLASTTRAWWRGDGVDMGALGLGQWQWPGKRQESVDKARSTGSAGAPVRPTHS